MKRRDFLKMATIGALAGFARVSFSSPNTNKPNFLFIIADDCTFRDIGCYGGQAYTPNIDKLANQGMRFTQCFQSAPMCSPTRHNIYTGQYPVKSGAYPNHTFVKPGTKSVVHYLKPHGYRVALSGKKHIGPRDAFEFEYSDKGENPDFDVIDKLMSDCKKSGTPFCLFACSNEPHFPWNKGDPSRYDPAKLELPPYFVDTDETRENMTRYLAEITYYDGQVGQALALLDKHGLADNTLVIVVTEQGSAFPFGKWTCYDTGLQSAFIARKQYVFGEMTTRGINNGSEHFGIRSIRSRKFKYIWNFTPEIKFQNVCTNAPIFKSWRAKAQSDSDAADKVRRYEHRPEEELYDVTKDQYEWNNLADDPKYARIKAELRKNLLEWMKAMGDKGQQTELEAFEHQNSGKRRKKKKSGKNRKKTQQAKKKDNAN
ncbi:MAG: sulfatase family protein [Planctomycetota bacterium]